MLSKQLTHNNLKPNVNIIMQVYSVLFDCSLLMACLLKYFSSTFRLQALICIKLAPM